MVFDFVMKEMILISPPQKVHNKGSTCGGPLRVIGFITEHKVIRKILDHLHKRNGDSRAPPIH